MVIKKCSNDEIGGNVLIDDDYDFRFFTGLATYTRLGQLAKMPLLSATSDDKDDHLSLNDVDHRHSFNESD